MIKLVCRGSRDFPHRKVGVYAYDGPLPPAIEHITDTNLELACRRCGYAPRVSSGELVSLLMIATSQGGILDLSGEQAARAWRAHREGKALPDPIQVPISKVVHAIYRLWGESDRCLYVGKTIRLHPLLRISEHAANKPWWSEVVRADYIDLSEMLSGQDDAAKRLSDCEAWHIRTLNPVYNKYRPGGWADSSSALHGWM